MQDLEAQIARKKRRATTRTAARSIAGTSLEVGACPIISEPSVLCKTHYRPASPDIHHEAAPEEAAGEQVINKRRAEKPEVRKASREAALREVCFHSPHHAWPHQHLSRCLEKDVWSKVALSQKYCISAALLHSSSGDMAILELVCFLI